MKRNLSDDSKEPGDDETKKARESQASSWQSRGDAFVGGLDYSTCRDVLYNC